MFLEEFLRLLSNSIYEPPLPFGVDSPLSRVQSFALKRTLGSHYFIIVVIFVGIITDR